MKVAFKIIGFNLSIDKGELLSQRNNHANANKQLKLFAFDHDDLHETSIVFHLPKLRSIIAFNYIVEINTPKFWTRMPKVKSLMNIYMKTSRKTIDEFSGNLYRFIF